MSDSNHLDLKCGCLNAREAARFLGISLRTLFTWTNRKEDAIPHLRIGSRVLYPLELLREWILRQVIHGGVAGKEKIKTPQV